MRFIFDIQRLSHIDGGDLPREIYSLLSSTEDRIRLAYDTKNAGQLTPLPEIGLNQKFVSIEYSDENILSKSAAEIDSHISGILSTVKSNIHRVLDGYIRKRLSIETPIEKSIRLGVDYPANELASMYREYKRTLPVLLDGYWLKIRKMDEAAAAGGEL